MFIVILHFCQKVRKFWFGSNFLRNVCFGSAKPVIFLRENVDSRRPTVFHVFSQKLEKWKTHFLNTAKTSSYATISRVFPTRKNIPGGNSGKRRKFQRANNVIFKAKRSACNDFFRNFGTFSHFFGLFRTFLPHLCFKWFRRQFFVIFTLFSHFRTFRRFFRKKTSRKAYWHSSRMVHPKAPEKIAESALFCRIYVSYGFGNPPAGGSIRARKRT